jgi:hypothetical protein
LERRSEILKGGVALRACSNSEREWGIEGAGVGCCGWEEEEEEDHC